MNAICQIFWQTDRQNPQRSFATLFATSAKLAKYGKTREFSSFATVLCQCASPGKVRSTPFIDGVRPLPGAVEVCHGR